MILQEPILEGGLNLAEIGELLVGVDHDGDPLHPVLVDPPRHGTPEIYSAVPQGRNAEFPDYNFIYTPNPGMEFGEEEIFTYRLSDGAEVSTDLIYVRIQRAPGAAVVFDEVWIAFGVGEHRRRPVASRVSSAPT